MAFLNLKNYQQAFADGEKAVKIDPNSSSAYNCRGMAYHHLKNSSKALVDLDKAIELDPKVGAFYINRASVYFYGLKKNTQAIDDLTKAIEIDPYDIRAYQLRGTILQMIGKLDKAKEDSDKVKELSPKK